MLYLGVYLMLITLSQACLEWQDQECVRCQDPLRLVNGRCESGGQHCQQYLNQKCILCEKGYKLNQQSNSCSSLDFALYYSSGARPNELINIMGRIDSQSELLTILYAKTPKYILYKLILLLPKGLKQLTYIVEHEQIDQFDSQSFFPEQEQAIIDIRNHINYYLIQDFLGKSIDRFFPTSILETYIKERFSFRILILQETTGILQISFHLSDTGAVRVESLPNSKSTQRLAQRVLKKQQQLQELANATLVSVTRITKPQNTTLVLEYENEKYSSYKISLRVNEQSQQLLKENVMKEIKILDDGYNDLDEQLTEISERRQSIEGMILEEKEVTDITNTDCFNQIQPIIQKVITLHSNFDRVAVGKNSSTLVYRLVYSNFLTTNNHEIILYKNIGNQTCDDLLHLPELFRGFYLPTYTLQTTPFFLNSIVIIPNVTTRYNEIEIQNNPILSEMVMSVNDYLQLGRKTVYSFDYWLDGYIEWYRLNLTQPNRDVYEVMVQKIGRIVEVMTVVVIFQPQFLQMEQSQELLFMLAQIQANFLEKEAEYKVLSFLQEKNNENNRRIVLRLSDRIETYGYNSFVRTIRLIYTDPIPSGKQLIEKFRQQNGTFTVLNFEATQFVDEYGIEYEAIEGTIPSIHSPIVRAQPLPSELYPTQILAALLRTDTEMKIQLQQVSMQASLVRKLSYLVHVEDQQYEVEIVHYPSQELFLPISYKRVNREDSSFLPIAAAPPFITKYMWEMFGNRWRMNSYQQSDGPLVKVRGTTFSQTQQFVEVVFDPLTKVIDSFTYLNDRFGDSPMEGFLKQADQFVGGLAGEVVEVGLIGSFQRGCCEGVLYYEGENITLQATVVEVQGQVLVLGLRTLPSDLIGVRQAAQAEQSSRLEEVTSEPEYKKAFEVLSLLYSHYLREGRLQKVDKLYVDRSVVYTLYYELEIGSYIIQIAYDYQNDHSRVLSFNQYSQPNICPEGMYKNENDQCLEQATGCEVQSGDICLRCRIQYDWVGYRCQHI